MSALFAIATGNLTTNTTWQTASAVSNAFVDSEAGSVALTTTTAQDSTAFTPAGTAVNAVAIKLSSITSSATGTLAVSFRNSTSPGTRDFTVTINISDLYANCRGWIVFKNGSSVTPNGTDSYVIRIVRSTSVGTVTYFATSSTAATMCRAAIMTTNNSPASGDQLIINGNRTGAGTFNAITVTLDNTATTSFGPTVSGGPAEGIHIGDNGTLQCGSASSTAYYLKWKGIMQIVAGGAFFGDNATATTGNITAASNKSVGGFVSDATNATPIVITTHAAHTLSTNDYVLIRGILGNTAANGTFKITSLTSTTFSLQTAAGSDVAGNGVFVPKAGPVGGTIAGGPQWIAPIAVTSTSHGRATGDILSISGIVGNIGANGAWAITVIDSNTFFLDGSMGTGAYTSGGTWVLRSTLASGSTLTLFMDSAANVDTGINRYNDGIFLTIGKSKTVNTKVKQSSVAASDTTSSNSLASSSGATVTWIEGAPFNTSWASDGTKTFTMNGTAYTISAVASTTSLTATATITTGAGVSTNPSTFAYTGTSKILTLQVDDTTGWAANDVLVVAQSSRRNEAEQVTISSVDSATQITATTAFTGYHSGLNDANGDVRAEVMNLTRTVIVTGASSTLQGFINIAGGTSGGGICCVYTEFNNLGSGTNATRGIGAVNSATQGMNILYCSLHDFAVALSAGIFIQSGGTNFPIVKNTVFWNITGNSFSVNAISGVASWTVDSCVFGSNLTSTTTIVSCADVGGSFTNNAIFGTSGAIGLALTEASSSVGIFTGNVIHSTGSAGLSLTGGQSGTIGDGTAANQRIWRCLANSIQITGQPTYGSLVPLLDGFTSFGSTTTVAVLTLNALANAWIRNGVIDAGYGPTSVTAVGSSAANLVEVVFDNMLIGQTTTLNTDVQFGSSCVSRFCFRSCKFGNTVWTTVSGSAFVDSKATSINHNQTAGSHQAYYLPQGVLTGVGKLSTDTVIYNIASKSLRMTPGSASGKLRSMIIQVPVTSGTTISVSVYVRKSASGDSGGADYNGGQQRLLVLTDPTIFTNPVGVDYTVLATAAAAVGSWEQLSATLAITGDGVARFVVDCDGTAGWINVDDFSCTTVNSTGFDYWGQLAFGPFVNTATVSPTIIIS